METLLEKYGNMGLEIFAFPCNQFGGQEPKGPREIKKFVAQYGFKGHLMGKVDVNGPGAHELFVYLRNHTLNNADIDWNYNKWIFDGKTGAVLRHYESSVSPTEAAPLIRQLIDAK